MIERSDLPLRSLDRFGEPGSPWVSAIITAVIDETISSGTVAMGPATLGIMHKLRDFYVRRVYLRPEAGASRRQVSTVIRELVDHFLDHPQEIPDSFRQDEADPLQHVMDYVPGHDRPVRTAPAR